MQPLQQQKRPVAITVSTNFSDILPYTLAQNARFFDHWYIITAPDDSLTHEVIAQSGASNITVIDYNFQSTLTDHMGRVTQRYFDKGGAIRLAQTQAYEAWPDHWYLVLDSDIMIRCDRDLITDHLCAEWIWGVQCRLDYPSIEDYRHGRSKTYFHGDPAVIGFFQLYKIKHFYEHSMDSNYCDNQFTDLWPPHHQKLLPTTVDHLGAWLLGSTSTQRGRKLGENFGS